MLFALSRHSSASQQRRRYTKPLNLLKVEDPPAAGSLLTTLAEPPPQPSGMLRTWSGRQPSPRSCQAIANNVEAEALAVLAEEFELRTAVVINEVNILVRLGRIAGLNNVVRLTRNDDSGHAKHADNLPLAGPKVNKYLTVPLCFVSVFTS